MQNIYKKNIILFLFLGIYACKKVITVDLKNATPQIIIQGNVTNEAGPYTVKITKTVAYTSDNIFPPVTGATVSIKDNTTNTTDALTETLPGIYSTSALQGVQGHSYTLSVLAEGNQYAAISTMPQLVPLDSITFINEATSNLVNVVVNFQDPVGTPNYYQFMQTSIKYRFFDTLKKIFVFGDRLSDGKYVRRQLLVNEKGNLANRDTALVEMQCIDKNIFNYFNQLDRITNPNNNQSSTPANPTSNINNNALGYFSAHTVQRKKAVVKL
ncbi:MAG TPA: DUF4249 domain-containing protein [Chitinophagaceae bacterium]|nr:DUF4249 domain-containing protein [Chitinophagaceae bacterium]